MKISEFETANVSKVYAGSAQNNASRSCAPKNVQAVDQADISSEAKELQTILARLKTLPGVRTELVARLKKDVSDGTLKVSGEKVAQGMAHERKQMKTLLKGEFDEKR